MNADDVLKAVEEIEFPEFVGPLKASLNEMNSKGMGLWSKGCLTTCVWICWE